MANEKKSDVTFESLPEWMQERLVATLDDQIKSGDIREVEDVAALKELYFKLLQND
jgi:hypothetical protein